MEFEYRLLEYTYSRYVQGSDDRSIGYALIRCPANASFANVRSTLFARKHKDYDHEIDIESVKDVTIQW